MGEGDYCGETGFVLPIPTTAAAITAGEPKKRTQHRPKMNNHCNVKYVTEQLDYIRYNRVDRDVNWRTHYTAFQ